MREVKEETGLVVTHAGYRLMDRNETKQALAWGTWAATSFMPAGWATRVISIAAGAPISQAGANWAVEHGWCLGIPMGGHAVFPYRC